MSPQLLLAIPAVAKVIDLYRFLLEGTVQWRAAAYTVGAWLLGWGLIVLISLSSFGTELGLDGLNLADQLLAGIALGSTASIAHDLTTGGKHVA